VLVPTEVYKNKPGDDDHPDQELYDTMARYRDPKLGNVPLKLRFKATEAATKNEVSSQ
jgi:hypothetical protein